jgi:hypothetical protein
MLDAGIVLRCRVKLIDVARKHAKITYGEMAKHLGVVNQSVGRYLDAIYRDETIAAGRPDLTLVVVYSETGYGRYNSRGSQPRSIKVDPKNPADVQVYDAELRKVYAHHWL